MTRLVVGIHSERGGVLSLSATADAIGAAVSRHNPNRALADLNRTTEHDRHRSSGVAHTAVTTEVTTGLREIINDEVYGPVVASLKHPASTTKNETTDIEAVAHKLSDVMDDARQAVHTELDRQLIEEYGELGLEALRRINAGAHTVEQLAAALDLSPAAASEIAVGLRMAHMVKQPGRSGRLRCARGVPQMLAELDAELSSLELIDVRGIGFTNAIADVNADPQDTRYLIWRAFDHGY